MNSFAVANVRLDGSDQRVAIVVRDGLITRLSPDPPPPETDIFDGQGGVAIPGLVDAHTHFDKSMLGAPWVGLARTSTVRERAAAGEDLVLSTERPTITERAEALARRSLAFGTIAARSHADVSPGLGLRAVEATLGLVERLGSLMNIQIVAFPQRGTRHPQMGTLLDEALSMGCDVIGGLDPAGFYDDVDGQVRLIFSLAVHHGASIDIHLHDRGAVGQSELMRICDATIAEGLGGRVAVSHAFCLADLDEDLLRSTLERLRQAGVAIITAASPASPMPPVERLWEHGVAFALGTDTAQSWSPFGTGDLLERASAFAARADLRFADGLRRTLEMATSGNAQVLGLPAPAIAVGSPAQFVVVDASSPEDAVAQHGRRILVVNGSPIG